MAHAPHAAVAWCGVRSSSTRERRAQLDPLDSRDRRLSSFPSVPSANRIVPSPPGCGSGARALGCADEDPFMPLSFLPLCVIPSLKLSDKGLVDVSRFEIVPLKAADQG